MKVKKPISFSCKLKKLAKSVSSKKSVNIKDDNYYVKKLFPGLNRSLLSHKSYTKNNVKLDSLSDLLYEFIYPDYKTRNIGFEKTLLLDYVRLGINEDCKFLLHRDGNTKFNESPLEIDYTEEKNIFSFSKIKFPHLENINIEKIILFILLKLFLKRELNKVHIFDLQKMDNSDLVKVLQGELKDSMIKDIDLEKAILPRLRVFISKVPLMQLILFQKTDACVMNFIRKYYEKIYNFKNRHFDKDLLDEIPSLRTFKTQFYFDKKTNKNDIIVSYTMTYNAYQKGNVVKPNFFNATIRRKKPELKCINGQIMTAEVPNINFSKIDAVGLKCRTHIYQTVKTFTFHNNGNLSFKFDINIETFNIPKMLKTPSNSNKSLKKGITGGKKRKKSKKRNKK